MPALNNRANLPDAVVRACQNDDYSMGDADYSCTGIIDAPRITTLKKRHGHEVVEDVLDRIWSMFGNLGHKLLERAGADNAFMEERLFADIGGRKISGASDVGQWVVEDGKITDYKFTSVFTAMFGDRVDDWTFQQNIYRWLWEKHGYKITALEVCAFFRDWRRGEAQKNRDYPPIAKIYKLEVWPLEKTVAKINERLTVLKSCEGLPDDELPECTPEQRWEKPTTYAVMKKGNKKASKVFDDEKDASNWMWGKKGIEEKGKPSSYKIELRPGKRIRCEDYCSVSPWCNTHQKYLKEGVKT